MTGSVLSGLAVSKWEPFLDQEFYKTSFSVYSLFQLDQQTIIVGES